jgi:hypothetical protein
MDFIKNIAYYSMREYLKTFDFSHIQQYVVDRKNNKTFENIESYLKYHNKQIKPCYYHPGLGPNGIFGIAFLDYFDKDRQNYREDFYFAGSSATSVYSVLLNCKKKIRFNSWLKMQQKNNNLSDTLLISDALNVSKKLIASYDINDYIADEIFINVLCYDIKNKTFKIIFFTNFIDMDDMLNCVNASCFIPNVSCNKNFMIYNDYLIFDTGIVDNICTLNYKFFNINIEENIFLKKLFSSKYYPQDLHHFVKSLSLDANKSETFNINFKNYYVKSLDNIKKYIKNI